jgi:hypothetical protein
MSSLMLSGRGCSKARLAATTKGIELDLELSSTVSCRPAGAPAFPL